ncbi:FMN1 protein, partial [Alcedo cyanopectus]|nr:FMN1 protein [Ceyx cyanopectus]
MEGTHTLLQLHKPIMELCYISYYIPEGKVRGFTYKGCVTLDRTSKRFCSCYQVRETLEMKLREQPYENFGDIIFKQTTTKDILIELYKRTDEKEKLFSSLLRSHDILDLNAGHQEEKQQDVFGVLKCKGDDYSSFAHQQGLFLDSTNKDILNRKKMREYRRKESFEELRHQKGGKNIYEQHHSLLSAQDMQLGNKKMLPTRFPTRSFPSSFSASVWLTVKSKDDLPVDNSLQPERWIGEGYFLESNKAVKLDANLSCSISKDSDDMVAAELVDSGECMLEVTADVYFVGEAAGDSKIVLQEKEQDSSGLLHKAERVHITNESHNLVGAVNKALLKVIQSDSLDEAAEWKRLQQITGVERNLPGSIYEKRTSVSQGSSKNLFLNLPVNESPDSSQTSNNFKLEEKKLHSPSLIAVSNVFSNSYPLSNTHKQMSPIPSPLSSRLPSPQLHHRILPLPTQNAEDESMLSDYGSGRHGPINLSINDSEPQFYLKFPESGELGFATRRPGLHQNATAGHFEKHTIQEKITAQTQQNFCP